MKKVFGWLLVLAVLCATVALPALAETITVADAGAYFSAERSNDKRYENGRIYNDTYTVSGPYDVFAPACESGIGDYVTQMKSLGWTVASTNDGNAAFFLRDGTPLVGMIYQPDTDTMYVYYQEGCQVEVARLAWTCFSCGGSGVCSCGDGYLMGERCLTCGGSAICQWCHGDGMTSDNENYGNRPSVPEGVCAICYGDGVCQICMGAGRISGIATYGPGGSDYVTCSGCNGSGRCEYCNGTGRDD